MQGHATPASARERELLDAAYAYVLKYGLSDLSLRPLAAAIGSSPRVLLFLFGSKEELIAAILRRARQDEQHLLEMLPKTDNLCAGALQVWSWLSDDEHAALLKLWVEIYARSLVDPAGPWKAFAERTVADWLELLAVLQPASVRRTKAGRSERTGVLAILRGAMLDFLATGDQRRTTDAVQRQLALISANHPPKPPPTSVPTPTTASRR